MKNKTKQLQNRIDYAEVLIYALKNRLEKIEPTDENFTKIWRINQKIKDLKDQIDKDKSDLTLIEQKKSKRTQINFRLPADELQTVKKIAKKSGLNLSEYARRSCLNPLIYVINISHDDAQKITCDMARIGGNLNQIARKLNQRADISDSDIKSVLNESKKFFDKLYIFLMQSQKRIKEV